MTPKRGAALGRLWPGDMAGRLALILLAGLLVVQAVGALFFLHERGYADREARAMALAEQVVAVVRLMEATPSAERPALLRALNSPLLHVELSATDPDLGDRARRWRGRALRGIVGPLLAALGERPFEVRLLDGWRDGPGNDAAAVGLVPSRRQLALTTGLIDGTWLAVTVPLGQRARSPAGPIAWFALTGLAVLLIGGFAARRVARPLERFAEAADRLGVDVHAPPLAEAGSRELRWATRAFNQMQERLRRLVDDRTMMLAAISHDLRTALTRLKLRTEFIDDDEQRRKALADLDEMQAMLESALAFARDEAASEARTELDLASLLHDVCDGFVDAGQRVSYAGPARLIFTGRPVALRRAFANLIDNAVTYGQEATLTVVEHGERVEVAIADRGPGVPADERERVFAPFYRLEPSRSRETGGVGLGLAVARAAIRRHGGEIVLGDRPGGGLLVRVILPRAEAADR